MSDQKGDPGGNILRDLGEQHEDQPDDIGTTKTDGGTEPEAPGPVAEG